MAIPSYYQPEKVGNLYIPNTAAATEAGRQAQLQLALTDEQSTVLMLVDMQVDFIHEDGALSVPGAVVDSRRTIEWIYRNAPSLTTIAASLDSHVPIQIFFPTWWQDNNEKHPEPFTVITHEAVLAGEWQPIHEPEWSVSYVQQLETRAKKELMIWPYHTLIGTPGHTLTPALYEALAYHSAARHTQPVFLSKGSIPKTEHYSMLEPEVKVPDEQHGGLNTDFLNMLATYDLIYVAGQAKSHCVLETVSSMMRYFANKPDLIAKLRILGDCMSSVAHPEIDFDALADKAFDDFVAQGMRIVQSTDAIG